MVVHGRPKLGIAVLSKEKLLTCRTLNPDLFSPAAHRKLVDCMVRPVGIEPTTLSLEGPPEAIDINNDSA